MAADSHKQVANGVFPLIMGVRRKSRELALQFLYGYDFQEHARDTVTVSGVLEKFLANFNSDDEVLPDGVDKVIPYAITLVTGICAQVDAIDVHLRSHSHNWRLERMSLVDRNILRIAAYEIYYCEGIPRQVAINEALEIAKCYSTPDSVSFINGILDALGQTD